MVLTVITWQGNSIKVIPFSTHKCDFMEKKVFTVFVEKKTTTTTQKRLKTVHLSKELFL